MYCVVPYFPLLSGVYLLKKKDEMREKQNKLKFARLLRIVPFKKCPLGWSDHQQSLRHGLKRKESNAEKKQPHNQWPLKR